MEKIINKISDFSIEAAGNIIFAFLVIVIGFKLVKVLLRFIQKGKGFNKLEKSVQTFVISFLSVAFRIVVLITAFSILGIPMTSMIALIGSFGLALGLALQGGLSNIAGSLMILIFKPFKVGDYIDTHTDSGFVKEISLFHTTLITIDNKKVVIPNGELSNSVVVNHTSSKKTVVDLKFSVNYNSDIDKVKKVLIDVASKNELVLKNEEIFARLISHSESSLIFELRVWTLKENYFPLTYDLLEDVKKAFDKNKIEIPYNQLDVHLDKKD